MFTLEPGRYSQNDAYATLTNISKMSSNKVGASTSIPMLGEIDIGTASKQPGKSCIRRRYRADVYTCHFRVQVRFTELGLKKRVHNWQLTC